MIHVSGGKLNVLIPMKQGSYLISQETKRHFFRCRYIPSNFARREKRSLLDKIISKRVVKKPILTNNFNNDQSLSLALVKFRYDAER